MHIDLNLNSTNFKGSFNDVMNKTFDRVGWRMNVLIDCLFILKWLLSR